MFPSGTDYSEEWNGWIFRWLGVEDSDVIQIALDGSTKGSYMAYAGAVANEQSWVALQEFWRVELEKHGLPYFSMSEAMTFNGAFASKRREWGAAAVEKRDALVRTLAELANRLELRGAGFAIHVAGLAEQALVHRKRALFSRVVRDLLKATPDRFQQIALMCDTEQDAADHFRKWVDNLKQDEDTGARRIVALCFVSSKAIYPVQYADMVAYLLREDTERLDEHPDQPRNPLYELVIARSTTESGHVL